MINENAKLFRERRGLEKEVTILHSNLKTEQVKLAMVDKEKLYNVHNAVKEAKMVKRRRTKDLLDKEREIHKKMKLKLDGAIIERIVSFCFVLFDEIVELCSDNFLYPLSRSHRMQVIRKLLRSACFLWSLFN